MGLHIGQKAVVRTKAIIVLVAVFALVAIPTFISVRSHIARAEGTPPRFTSSFYYVHADTSPNQHDIAVEVEFFPGTTRVDLKVDNVPVPDDKVPDPTKQVSTLDNSNKLVIYMSLAPGPHTFTGTAIVNDNEVPIKGAEDQEEGLAVTYALDMPVASYTAPSAQKQAFNSQTSPVRVTVDDEFNQFKNLVFGLYTGKPGDVDSKKVDDFILAREQCNTEAENFVVCDITAASNWKKLAEGTYFVKLQTSTKAEDGQHPDGIKVDDQSYWSLPFTIDDTPPTATIEGPLSVIGGEKIVVQGKIDPTASEATLYIDGDAMGLADLGENGVWSYALKADLALGDHKVKLIAKDAADNTNIATIDAATTDLTVNPFIPSKTDVQQVNDAAVGLTAPFAVPQALTKEDIPPVPATVNSDMGVLGAQDALNSKIDQEKVIAAVAPSGQGWKLFGIAWFWWFFGAIGLVGISSWALASKRQYGAENI